MSTVAITHNKDIRKSREKQSVLWVGWAVLFIKEIRLLVKRKPKRENVFCKY